MRVHPWLMVGMVVMLGLLGCGRAKGPRTPLKWSNGFWFWRGSSAAVGADAGMVDAIYFQAGAMSLREAWPVSGSVPKELPAAREYWMVWRWDEPGIPRVEMAPVLGREVEELLWKARERGLAVAGVQLDIDSPTRRLGEYAKFLQALRKAIGPEVQISITALLDWFRDGTAIGDVVEKVDEFVPQFYDLEGSGTAIAARLDGAKWRPRFERFGKRFRVGVATFGRARPIAAGDRRREQGIVLMDVKPLDLALNPAFALETGRTEAGELVLRYRAKKATPLGYGRADGGDGVEFRLATAEVVRKAVAQARLMGELCAGMVFFRWPSDHETLAMAPDEVLQAAGAIAEGERRADKLRVVDGGCAAVSCVDLYLDASRLAAEAVRYRVVSVEQLEYFVPQEGMPARMVSPGRVEFKLPPYGGRNNMYLGRAVAGKRGEFRLEVNP